LAIEARAPLRAREVRTQLQKQCYENIEIHRDGKFRPNTVPGLYGDLMTLDRVRGEVAEHGRVQPESQKSITEIFGAEFSQALVESDCRKLATQMIPARLVQIDGEEDKGRELPPLPATPEEERAFLRQQILLKSLDIATLYLYSQLSGEIKDGPTNKENTHPLDLYVRYQTTARRELYRALEAYREAKANFD
jgi:hypothetical protein